MSQTEMDKNLLVVTAIQGYAENHHISESEAFDKFSRHNIQNLIRDQYDALHTQPLEETIDFVEDVMKRYEGE
ncbi:DUF3791 domain-containing protein [uncultured Treponema sp.]|jgi:hypothetical protein|uniref:DUF3791 domain-containing protein n=1 Tax=uncultured Treponema sp. TaxID=162155 RepID=UPI0025CEA817|nr:DUF3791 domain-containing protein [uncultured Treponema sp.]